MWRRKERESRERRLVNIEARLKILECPHERVKFLWCSQLSIYTWVNSTQGTKECQDCGKVLARYNTRKEYLLAKLDNIQEKETSLVDQIKAELDQMKKDEEAHDVVDS